MREVTLKNFDTHVDSVILERGEHYYNDGSISLLKEQGPEVFVARIHGSEVYSVRVELDEDDVLEYTCSCPYNKGPMCKHVVAVLFALADGERDIDDPHESNSIGTSSTHSTAAELSDLSKEQLTAIVQEARTTHADVDRRVKMLRAEATQFEDKQYSKNIIRSSLNSATNRWGGIDYGKTLGAVQGALEVLDVAESLTSAYPRAAASVYEAVIEILAPVIGRADDSDGDIGGTLYSAFEQLHQLAIQIRDQTEEEELRTAMFRYIIKEWPKKKYQGWDWPDLFLRIAADLVVSKSEELQLDRVLERFLIYDREKVSDDIKQFAASPPHDVDAWHTSFLAEYRLETIASIRLLVLERLHPQNVDSFLQQNIHLYNLRKEIIERRIASCDYKNALLLAQEGVTQAQVHNTPGLVGQFKTYVMQCAAAGGDYHTACQEAVTLFLETYHDAFTYYRKAREYAGADWLKVRTEIIATLRKQTMGGDRHKLADVFVGEGMWEELLQLVQTDVQYALTYGKRLEKRFPTEIGQCYVLLAQEDMKYAGGRSVYQDKCKLLKTAKQLGCEKEVNEVIKIWREQYPNRRALMEEIVKVL